MKRFISLLITACLLITCASFSLTANAADDTVIDGGQIKISKELSDVIADSDDDIIPIYIALKKVAYESKIEEQVRENYTWTNDDDYLKYYRSELKNTIEPYVQQFIDDNAGLIDKVLVKTPFCEFIIAEVRKENIERLAELPTVTEISYFPDLVQVNEDGQSNRYENEFFDWMVQNERFSNYVSAGYSYNELFRHETEGVTDWALVTARCFVPEPDVMVNGRIGNRLIISGSIQVPFACGYGIYDVSENNFYDLYDFPDACKKYNGLAAVTGNLQDGYHMGDVDLDGNISVIDATRIQKSVAGIVSLAEPCNLVSDVNGDGVTNIIDATEIQKFLAGLPSYLS